MDLFEGWGVKEVGSKGREKNRNNKKINK